MVNSRPVRSKADRSLIGNPNQIQVSLFSWLDFAESRRKHEILEILMFFLRKDNSFEMFMQKIDVLILT